jgi:ATP-dependent DNA ligase I
VELRALVDTSAAVGATRARTEKVAAIAALLARAAPEEVRAAVAFLSGELVQRQIGVGHALMRDLPPPSPAPSLTVAAVDGTFARIGAMAGPGSQRAKRDALGELLARADADEQRFLVRLLVGDLSQGALGGVMVEAIARAANVPAPVVRRGLMLRGDLPAVAELALTGGAPALQALGLQIGRPLAPMLAGTAADLQSALAKTGPALVEWKLDGARVQVHRDGADVAVFTRTLDDVTARVPEVIEAALALRVDAVVLDGEAIALRPDGRPRPFQVTASRFGSRRDVAAQRAATPLTPFLFDLLHLDGDDLLDAPLHERAAALDDLVPAALRPGRATRSGAQQLLDDALARGHEGAMVKALDAPWVAGRRGGDWLKVKPVHALDLVVLAAEWGHGRRRGFLSNLHLGARDADGWAMLGKTFKGLTDALLAWQTERLLALETHRDRYTVHVRPELVVEIAFDGVQRSTRYPSGLALRFARVKRYREDKTAAEADAVTLVRALLPDG